MICIPPEPNPGDRVSANLIGQIIRCLRQLRPIDSPTVVSSTGPNGTVYRSAATKKARVKHQEDLGCFYIASKSVEAGEDPEEDPSTIGIEFGNPYYRCAGKTFESAEDAISDVELPAIVALKVDITGDLPDAELTSYSSLQELYADEKDKDYVIHPLYKFDASGKLVCDFRNILQSDMAEFANPE